MTSLALRAVALAFSVALLAGCESVPQKTGAIMGTADKQEEIQLNAGGVRFMIKMDHDKPEGQPMIVNFRDRNGSIVKELFRSDKKKSTEMPATADAPGTYSVEVRGATGAWEISWGPDTSAVK